MRDLDQYPFNDFDEIVAEAIAEAEAEEADS